MKQNPCTAHPFRIQINLFGKCSTFCWMMRDHQYHHCLPRTNFIGKLFTLAILEINLHLPFAFACRCCFAFGMAIITVISIYCVRKHTWGRHGIITGNKCQWQNVSAAYEWGRKWRNRVYKTVAAFLARNLCNLLRLIGHSNESLTQLRCV